MDRADLRFLRPVANGGSPRQLPEGTTVKRNHVREFVFAFSFLVILAVLDLFLKDVILAPLVAIPLLVIAYFGGLRLALVVSVACAVYFGVIDYSPLAGTRLVLTSLPVNSAVLGVSFCAIAYTASLLQQESRRRTELQVLARTDLLTELTNRRGFEETVDEAIALARVDGVNLALFYVDLDGFKTINDRYGHEVGDRVLRIAAQRIAASVRKDDVVARIGGDEFAVISRCGAGSDGEGNRLAANIRQAFGDPIILDSHTISLSASVGAAMAPTDGTDTRALLRMADGRMYADKKQRITG